MRIPKVTIIERKYGIKCIYSFDDYVGVLLYRELYQYLLANVTSQSSMNLNTVIN